MELDNSDSSITPEETLEENLINKEIEKNQDKSVNNDESDEEEIVCRVCRCGGIPGETLFYPCKCSGSIKYIHSNCLITWIKHSKSKMCELCKTPYAFQPVYAPNTPKSLPIRDLITGIGSHIFRYAKIATRVTAALSMWIFMVPLSTTWLRKLILAPFFTFDFQSILDTFRFRTLFIDCIMGILLTGFIIFAVLAVSSLKDYLESHGYLPPLNIPDDAEIELEEEQEEEENEQQQQQQQQQVENEEQEVVNNVPIVDQQQQQQEPAVANGLGNVNVNNVDNWEIDVDELIGLTGSLSRLFVKALTAILWISIFLISFLFIPRIFGSSTITLLSIYKQEDIEFGSTIAILSGYLFFISIGAIWLTLSEIYNFVYSQQDTSPATQSFRYIFLCLKVILLLLAELVAFPLACGYCLSFSLSHLYGNTSLPERLHPVFVYILLWFCGLMYMLYFSKLVSGIREILRDGILWFFRNPEAPDFDPIREIIQNGWIKHMRRFTTSAMIYGFVMWVTFWAPIVTCNYLFPGILPYKSASTNDMNDIPFNIIVFHIILPYSIDHFSLYSTFKAVMKKWTEKMGKMLDLTNYLFEDNTYHPPHFLLRVSALLLCGFFTLYLISCFLLIVPVTIGSNLIYVTLNTQISDLMSTIIGLYTLAALYITINYILSSSIRILYFAVIGLKWLFLLSFWLVLIPGTVGLLWDYIVLSVMFPLNESIDRHLLQDWAIGLLLFQSWFRIVTIQGVSQHWRRLFDIVMQEQGIVGIDVFFVTREIIVPIMGYLLTCMAVPNVLAYGLVPLLTESVRVQLICVRYVYTCVALQGIMCVCIYYGTKGIFKLYPIVKQSILDDKYLIGHRLRNVDEM